MYTTPATQTSSQLSTLRAFFNRTYSWMGAGLLLTAFTAWFTAQNDGLMSFVMSSYILLIVLQFGFVFAIGGLIQRMSPAVAGISFALFAVLNGLTLSGIFLRFTDTSILSTFLTTSAMFGAMSLYGYTTKADLSKFRSILFMGVIGLLVAIVINLFVNSGPLGLIISLVGVVIFTALTAYDTQNLKNIALSGALDGQGGVASANGERFAILGALSLYLNFINIFIFLLNIFGGRSSD